MTYSLSLRVLPGTFAICRREAHTDVPQWAARGMLTSITRTPDELSILCPAGAVPAGEQVESDWRALKVEGPLAFNMVGVLAAILAPLADAGVVILALSTFDTDYIFVKQGQLSAALQALRSAGHILLPDPQDRDRQ